MNASGGLDEQHSKVRQAARGSERGCERPAETPHTQGVARFAPDLGVGCGGVRPWSERSRFPHGSFGPVSLSDIPSHEPGLRFSGGRFDTQQLSAEAFAAAGQEFLAFQQTIIAIASHLYRKDHPSASQLPNHFADRLRLGIEDVLRGSLGLKVKPIEPDPTTQQLFEFPRGYYENSIDTHHSIVAEVREKGRSELLQDMPRTVGEALARMGRQLEDDERIVVTNTSGIEYYLDRSVREQLESSLTSERRMCDLIAGRITRVEADRSRITMVLCTEARPVNTEIIYAERVSLDTIKSALTPLRDEGPIVAARGAFFYEDASFDTASSTIEELSTAGEDAPRRVQGFIEELESIASLSDGWYDKESPAPNDAAILGARALIAPLLFYDLPFPHAFPLASGGVSLEWSLKSVEASVTFHTSSETATVASWDSITDEHRYDESTLITGDFLREWLDSFESASRV